MSINITALATHSSHKRGFYFFFVLTIVCLVYWYHASYFIHDSPEWEIVDFRIPPYASEGGLIQQHQALSDNDDDDTFHDRFPDTGSYAVFQQQSLHDDLQSKILDFIQWKRPSTDHWPTWSDYEHTDYDPNRWEAMEREYGFFLNNTIPELESRGIKPEPYLPYPRYNTEKWKRRWHGKFYPCQGPHGEKYAKDSSGEYIVQGYRLPARSLPSATVGSAKLLGLDSDICFDRHSRFAASGLIDSNQRLSTHKQVDWNEIRWGVLQDTCFTKNAERFAPEARHSPRHRLSKQIQSNSENFDITASSTLSSHIGKRHKPRTAILIRTWEGYEYGENDIQAIRALVAETSLMSGGEYQVFLFVNIKQRDADIYGDERVYQDLLKKNVPQEFQDIAVLWTERVCEDWYPLVGDWQVYWMQFMPLQWFSIQHPEFEYIWNWEIDARYIGNYYHFFERVADFATQVPRKHLWERNSRFFFPNLWNGDYDAFLADTDEQISNATAMGLIDEPIWGPKPYAPFQFPVGPPPPRSPEEDHFEWGVGEEADLITLQPIWDPAETGWSYRNHIWNFIPEVRPEFTSENGNADGFDHPGFPTIPRRVFINTVVRFSRKMLHTMHVENLQGRSMQAEMWPATVALQHGLKAVYAPHPIWTDRKWPAWYVEAVFNANDGIPARWSQQQDSPYNHDREANFGGWSWYYRSVFPHVLYRRWLGWKAKDWGWDASEAKSFELEAKKALFARLGKSFDETEDLRMCLPGMLLHPVKNVFEDVDGG